MESQSLSLSMAIFATCLSALIIIAERAFPFVLFSKKQPPKIITFIEQFIPPMVMACLLIYSLKDINFTTGIENFLPALIGVAATIGLHLWKSNSLISIFGGTILYMILIRVL